MGIPAKLLRAGVTDMVRISDGRMSGTAFGTVILHVAPEAAIGGALALVENGDWITAVVVLMGRQETAKGLAKPVAVCTNVNSGI